MSGLTVQQLAQLAGVMQERSEREKSDLARVLHDELGGLLTAAKMDVAWLQGRLAPSADPETSRKLAQLESALATAMSLKRGVVEQLRPALLDHFGLPMALRSYFDETCRRAGLQLDAQVRDDLPRLPPDLAIALYRVAEGCLSNVLRHSRGSKVQLVLQTDGAQLRLAIADDGAGMDPADPRVDTAPGLCGMRHRILRLGGRFELVSEPDKGCRVEICVPLP